MWLFKGLRQLGTHPATSRGGAQPWAVTKAEAPHPARDGQPRRAGSGRDVSPFWNVRGMGEIGPGAGGGLGAFPGLALEAWRATLALLFRNRDCSIPARKSPSRPLVATERTGSAALASHKKNFFLKKRKKKKKWVRQLQRGKSIGIREKREESQTSHSCLTGSQLAPQKKKKSLGVNASGGGCVWRGGSGVKGRPGGFTIVSGSSRGSPGGGRRRGEAASAPFAPPDLRALCAEEGAGEPEPREGGRDAAAQPPPPPCPTKARRTSRGSR